MYIRITTMSYDPDREGEFMAIADAARDAARPKIHGFLGKLAAVLTAPPEMQEGPVIWEL